jgi:hypothetical protein
MSAWYLSDPIEDSSALEIQCNLWDLHETDHLHYRGYDRRIVVTVDID